MGAHRCCDCQQTIVSSCTALVAGDPPSPCNWWPEAYSVNVEFSGVSYVRQFNAPYLSCQPPHPPIAGTGLAWCRTIDWSWSLTTTIYRVRNYSGFGSFGVGIRCPDVAIPDDGLNVAGVGDDCNNNGVPDGNTDCGSTPYFNGSVPSYSSPCCCDSAAVLTGVADRTVFSPNNYAVGSQFGVTCLMNHGETTDSISFSRKCRVVGFCIPGRARINPNGPASQSVGDGTVRFQVAVLPFDGQVDEGGPCQNSETTAWWPSRSSLVVAPNGFGPVPSCLTGTPTVCDPFNIYGDPSCQPGYGSARLSSEPLILEQPGVVGSMGVGDAFGMPLIYEHGCGPSGGCNAPVDQLDSPYLLFCSNTNAVNYACTQVTGTVTPIGGSI